MKKYISIVVICLAFMTLGSCSKDTEGLTGITYYPVIELDGPVDETILAGTPYVEHGYKATLNGEDYTSEVEVVTNLNFNDPQPGYYYINYTAINADGFSTTVSRHILVVDENDPVNGWYTSNPSSNRDYNGITYFGGFPVMIYCNADGSYHVSDLLGGWYEYRAGYGSQYALVGDISVDANGNIGYINSITPAWGYTADSITDGSFDAETGTMTYTITFMGMVFNMTLDKD